MASPRPVDASDALSELVNQFSDPLSFFRELIQNSLDAGSAEVEVRIEYEPAEDGQGAMIIHVDDWGEGMDREIIDKRLTRLFSSGKDGDMTKIGKFGIGFVSVFAIDPQAVVVDTSRAGEHWRIIFDEKRAFTRSRREKPVDGTKVTLYKTATRAEFDEFVQRAEHTVRYWCKHTRGEVRFQGVVINEPFGLELPCRVARDDGFSTIVVAHPRDGKSFFGFYNQGLTLMEGGPGHIEGIAFKISSPHIEHTLTRDDVIQDEAFHKVLGDARRLATNELAVEVCRQLEVHAGAGGLDEHREYLFRALAWHLRSGVALPHECERRPVLPVCGGKRASIADCRELLRRRRGPRRLVWSSSTNPLTLALVEQGTPVFEFEERSAGVEVLQWLGQEGRPADEQTGSSRLWSAQELFCLPLVPPEPPGPPWTALAQALTRLLDQHGAKLSGVSFAHFRYPGSSIGKRVAITQQRPGEITELAEATELGRSLLSSRRALVVNHDHAGVVTLAELARLEPELAAYQLAKLFFLGIGLDVALDTQLANLAAEHRWQRSSS